MIYTIKFNTDKYFSGIPNSQIREFIISSCENKLNNEDMKKLVFHLSKEEFEDKDTRKIPHIVFSKPKQESFSLKAFNDDGLELLLKIKKILEEVGFIRVKKGNGIYNIVSTKLYTHNLLPEKTNKAITYKTTSPILLFKGNRRRIFDAIYNKYKHDTKLMNKEFQISINKMLIAYMKNLANSTGKKRNYEIFNKIDIEWTDFKIIFITDRNQKTPAIVGELKSTWKLPHLLGNRIGAGFGHIMEVLEDKNYDREFIKEQASKKTKDSKSHKEVYKNGSGWSSLFTVSGLLAKFGYFKSEGK